MSLDALLIAFFCVVDVALVGATMRVLVLHPTPAFATGSVRGASDRLLPRPPRSRRMRGYVARHQLLVALAMFAFVMAATFLPSWHVDIPPLDDPKAATDYLETLWQVLAAAVGISIALIAFVFEAFLGGGERRHGGTLREFASDTWLLAAIDLAAASLIAVGVVLQGNLRDAPAGWAGAMAILFSGAALISLLMLLPRRILGVIDPEHLRRMRSQRMNETVEHALHEQLVGQIGEHLVSLKVRVRRGLRASTDGAVRSRRDGYVYDVRVDRLERAARRTGGTVELLVAVGDEVQAGQTLVSLPASSGRLQRRLARRSVRVRRRTRLHTAHALDRTLDRLAQQGRDAIRARQEAEWREIADLYRDILVRFPTVTHELRIPFEGAVSRPGFFGYGPTSRLLRDLRADIEEVLLVDDPAIADSLAYTFLRVADAVAGLRAPAIIRDALGMYVAMYHLASEANARRSSRTSVRLLDRSTRLPFEALTTVGGHELGEPLRPELSRADAINNVRAAFVPLQNLLRSIVTRRDESGVRSTLVQLREATELWDGSEPPIERLLGEVDGMVLALVMWASFRHRRDDAAHTAASADTLGALRVYALTPGRALNAYAALEAGRGYSFGDELDFWFYDDERGGTQTLDSGPELDRALALMLLVAAARDGSIALDAHPVLDHHGAGLLRALDEIEATPTWGFLVPADAEGSASVDPFQAAVDAVRAALRTAIDDRKAAIVDQLRDAGLDAEQVQQFERATIRAARARRVVRDLMAHVGAVVPGAPDDAPQRLVRRWIDKRFFTGDSSYVGQDMTARDLARSATGRELRDLVDVLQDDPVVEDADVAGAVAAAIRSMRAEGWVPSLILLPIGWELATALGISPLARPQIDAPSVPAAHAGDFDGLIDEVPVLDSPHVRADLLHVIDLRRAAQLREWPSASGSGVEVRVRAFDAAQADTFVAEHPKVIPAHQTAEETALILQEQALLELEIRWRIVGLEPGAVRTIRVPETLRWRRPGRSG